MLNCDCARAIERAISENYKDNHLGECAKSVIDLYGFERVNWVLKNTVQRNMEDGRYSAENKELQVLPSMSLSFSFTSAYE